MKRKFNYLLLIAVATLSLGFVSCSDDDDFDSSIFDTVNHPLDKTAFTFPLDTFVKVNFLEPYNLRFIYRMEDIGSDMRKNLVPAAYDKSCELAVLSKYLWYDVYKENSPETFLQENSPRIIHVVGSKNYNPTQGTEVLGVAEGGLKITLYNVNNLNVNDMDMMNEYFFKTMHHEFGHILDQTHLRPTAFNTISSGHYNATTWQETPDSVSIGNGFVSSYASSAASEDWVETLANYITMDSVRWLGMLNSASYEWEEIDHDKALYEDKMKGDYSRDTIGYLNVKDNGDKKIYRRVCQRNGDGTVDLDEEGNVQWLNNSGIKGNEVILQKLDLVREWLKTYFGIELDKIRYVVQSRSYQKDADGKFVLDALDRPVNKLTLPLEEDPEGRTLIEVLLDGINKYKALQ
jgi:substrate import-associated zinc metallohydrolase lipoprotein